MTPPRAKPKAPPNTTSSIGKGTPEFYWHVHHEVLCETLTEPLQNRIDYIKENKPKKEIKTRLKWLTPVLHPDRLPSEWKEADQKWKEADQKWEEAYQKWEEAYQKWKEADQKWEEAHQKWKEAYQKREEAHQKWKEAYQKFKPELEALHKEEHPDCPWNGRTIFP